MNLLFVCDSCDFPKKMRRLSFLRVKVVFEAKTAYLSSIKGECLDSLMTVGDIAPLATSMTYMLYLNLSVSY